MGRASKWQGETRWAVDAEAIRLARRHHLTLMAVHEMNGNRRGGMSPDQAEKYAVAFPWTVSIELEAIHRIIEQPRTPWAVVRATVYLDHALRWYRGTPYAPKIRAAIRRGGR